MKNKPKPKPKPKKEKRKTKQNKNNNQIWDLHALVVMILWKFTKFNILYESELFKNTEN